MLRLLARLAFLASIIYSAHSWQGCGGIQFCKNYRHQTLSQDEQYRAEVGSISGEKNIANIPLKNNKNEELTLQISFLENNNARMKISSENHKRYELLDVLESEPKIIEYIADKSDDTVTLTPKESKISKVVVKKGAPFSVEFYYNNDLQSIFDGKRFVMKNTEDDESYHFDVIFPTSKVLYGLHHHATKLVLMETADDSHEPYRLRNSDAVGYQVGNTQALYGAVPVLWGHSPFKTSGVFLHNAAQQWVDITYKNQPGPSAHFMVESAALDLFILMGPTPKEVVRQYADLTGKAHMPQMWTLGYHQCRYSYQTQEVVQDILGKMEEYRFPMDAIWLDIDYTDAKKYFTWHPTNFKDPEAMQESIAATKRKLVTIIDPHIKVEDGYSVYDGAKGKYFIKDNSSNNDFQGDCWPGRSSWIDFLNPEARDYWVKQYSYSNFNGSTPVLAGTWNDMNEPSVFNADANENSLPGDALHFGNVKHRDIHNAYGFLQTKASHEALLKRDDGKLRPFVLTRSHFAGSQRYAAMWTGDNRADFPYLPITYSECMLSGLLGHVFCGADIGGFDGNPGDNLLQRWYQAAVWLPFFRGHSNSNTNRREPYLFDESIRDVIRNAIQTRYSHLHVFYTLFYLHSKTGDPISRPLFYEYPEMMDQDDHLLLGSDILAVPVMQQDANEVQAHFPGNSSTLWYRADLDEWSVYRGGSQAQISADINTSPYFYRGGSIIARKNDIKRSTPYMKDDRFTVYVNYDTKGKAEGLVYDDDQASFDYLNGRYYLIKLEGLGNQVQLEKIDGNMPIEFQIENIIVHTVSSKDPTEVIEIVYTKTANGTPLIDIDFSRLQSDGYNNTFIIDL